MATELGFSCSRTHMVARSPNSKLMMSEDDHDDDSWEVRAFEEDTTGNLLGCTWPPRSYTCTFCRREFRSAQALGGHMNVHRRDRARLHDEVAAPPLLPPPTPAKAAAPSLLIRRPSIGGQEFLTNGLCLVYPNTILIPTTTPPNMDYNWQSSVLPISHNYWATNYKLPNNNNNNNNDSTTLLVTAAAPNRSLVSSLICHPCNTEPSPSNYSNDDDNTINNDGGGVEDSAMEMEELDLELRLGRSSPPPPRPRKRGTHDQIN